MAQPMMHLLVADKIYAEKPGSIHSYGEFLLGSIAPDAVHMREECTREQKRISHYRFHLLSDIIWYHSVRVPFMEKFQQMPSHDISMNEAYYADCDQLEQLLFGEKDSSRIKNLLISLEYPEAELECMKSKTTFIPILPHQN